MTRSSELQVMQTTTRAHTPGPWEVDDENNICADNRVIATTYRCKSDDEWDANARLIAAAPELLEALELIVESHDAYCDKHVGVSQHSHDLAKIAEKAIARATGGSTDHSEDK